MTDSNHSTTGGPHPLAAAGCAAVCRRGTRHQLQRHHLLPVARRTAIGSTVNLASRMESQGQVGSIQITEATRQRLRETFSVQERGRIEVKGFGEMNTFLLLGKI